VKQYLKIIFAPLIALVLIALLAISVQAQPFASIHAQGIVSSSPNAHITVTVSLAQDKELVTPTLAFINLPTLPARLNLIDSAFTIQTQNIPTAWPMTIKIHYVSVSVDEKQLTIVYYDPSAEKWLSVPTVIDLANHTATANADQTGTYALVLLLPAVQLPPRAIIVDDRDTSRFGRSGNSLGWHSVYTTTPDRYYLNYMYWTSNTYSSLDNYGIWTPTLSSGWYQVYAFIDWDNATTQKARYQIIHNGQTTIYTVNQNSYIAQWVSLGTYNFGSAANSNYVRLDDVTGETSLSKRVGLDAIGFVPNKVYLPIVLNNYQTLPPPPAPKYWSGMHMGNRNNEDWASNMLAPFDPALGGTWPKIAVALTRQVFNITRDTTTCRINGMSVKNPYLYDFLRRATQQGGTRVIFRVFPSPGNFEESILPNWNIDDPFASGIKGRTLIVDQYATPSGKSQCGNTSRFRSVSDIGDEIIAIQRYILWVAPFGYQWQAYGFEPANETNTEWYDYSTQPGRHQRQSWKNMDQYFANLYDYVQANRGFLPVSVFTPPMAQNAYAEMRNVTTDHYPCDPFGDGSFSGYEVMTRTFNSLNPKNDGYSWHNYWANGKEDWADCPNGQHVSMWFPSAMNQMIQNGSRPAIITESDLDSIGHGMGNTLDKESQPWAAAVSIRDFIWNEPRAARVAVWLLNDNNDPTNPANAEHQWHQAYTSTVGFREWFIDWWYSLSEIP
jgi:hypothetical protein